MSDGALSYKSFVREPVSRAWPLTNGQSVVPGEIAALDFATGRVRPADDASGYLPLGLVRGPGEFHGVDTLVAGGSGMKAGDAGGTYSASIDIAPMIIEGVTVAGFSAATNTGDYVYLTDGKTLTLTQPADDAVIFGVVLGVNKTDDSLADIITAGFLGLFGPVTAPGRVDTWWDLAVPAFGGGGGTTFTITAPCRLKLKSLDFVASVAVSTASSSFTVQVAANASNMLPSAATVALADVNAKGKVKNVPLTQNQIVNQGDTITLTCIDGGTAMANGALYVRAYFDVLPGA